MLSKVIKKISNSILSNNTQINLGRWKIKSPQEIEYFMNRLHADPGYPLKYYKTEVNKFKVS